MQVYTMIGHMCTCVQAFFYTKNICYAGVYLHINLKLHYIQFNTISNPPFVSNAFAPAGL